LEYSDKPGKSPPRQVMQGYQWVYLSAQQKLIVLIIEKSVV